MKLHQKVSLYVVALIILVSFATNTFASCPMMSPGPPCQEFWRADTVFIGIASRVVRVPNQTGLMIGPYVRSTVHFSVEEAFKGVEGTVVVFDLDHCGHRFNEGERYLVYAHYNSYANKLEVRAGSTRTQLLSEATEDLAYIRGLPAAESGARLFGKVVQQINNVKDNKFETQPLKDIRVSLVDTNDERREVVTDSEGRYEFRRVATGTYQLRAEIPSYLSYQEETLKVTNRACIPLDIHVTNKGRIAGRVLDLDGKTVADVAVTLVSADAKREHILAEGKDRSFGPTVYSNRDGTYSFSQLMPGRYLLIVNGADRMSPVSEILRALPRLFYPGVTDLGAATVIVLTNDQKSEPYDFVLPIQQ